MKKMINFGNIHIAFLIYSVGALFSKLAGNSNSIEKFIMYYMICVLCLGIYAILWQKILKKNTLTIAYLNKGITIIWGIVFGILFFQETITLKKIIGIFFIITGLFIANKKEVSS